MIENLDPVLLSRIQFAFTLSFHIFFPAFTIGLASWLAVLEWRWLKTGNTVYAVIYRMWVKIFAVTFGMGVVSGVVMSFQFGTNWSAILGQSRKHSRAVAGLRSAERILSGGLISWGHVVWLEPGQPQDAFCCDSDCGDGDPDFRILDPVRQ